MGSLNVSALQKLEDPRDESYDKIPRRPRVPKKLIDVSMFEQRSAQVIENEKYFVCLFNPPKSVI